MCGITKCEATGLAKSVVRLAMDWKVRGLELRWGKIFATTLTDPEVHSAPCTRGTRSSVPGVKGRGVARSGLFTPV